MLATKRNFSCNIYILFVFLITENYVYVFVNNNNAVQLFFIACSDCSHLVFKHMNDSLVIIIYEKFLIKR